MMVAVRTGIQSTVGVLRTRGAAGAGIAGKDAAREWHLLTEMEVLCGKACMLGATVMTMYNGDDGVDGKNRKKFLGTSPRSSLSTNCQPMAWSPKAPSGPGRHRQSCPPKTRALSKRHSKRQQPTTPPNVQPTTYNLQGMRRRRRGRGRAYTNYRPQTSQAFWCLRMPHAVIRSVGGCSQIWMPLWASVSIGRLLFVQSCLSR